MTDPQSLIASFALLMTDSARVWYRSLKASDLNSFEHLARLFIIRFNEDKKIWTRTAELWRYKMTNNQTVAAFIADLTVRASQLGVSDKDTFLIALNGLLPRLRSSILLKEPRNLTELIQYASLIEVAHEPETEPYNEIAQTLVQMQEQLNRLQPANVIPLRTDYNSKRVSFQDQPYDEEIQPPQRNNNYREPRSVAAPLPPPWDYNQMNQAQEYNDYPSNNVPRAQPFFGPGTSVRGRSFAPNTNRPRFQQNRYTQAQDSQRNQSACWNCGTIHTPRRCPAFKSTCTRCFRIGHWSPVCRANLTSNQ
jgi:hypothetical protein